MNEIAAVEDSKEFLKKIVYNIRYGKKFKKFNIDNLETFVSVRN